MTEVFQHPNTYVPFSILVLMGLVAFWLRWKGYYRERGYLTEAAAILASGNNVLESATKNPIIGAVAAHTVNDEWISGSNGKILLSGPLGQILHARIRNRMEGMLASAVPSIITAVGLLMTFCLIAWALVQLGNTLPTLSTGDAAKIQAAIGKELGENITIIGSKFFVSAFAVGTAAAYLVFAILSRRWIYRETRRFCEEHKALFLDVSDLFRQKEYGSYAATESSAASLIKLVELSSSSSVQLEQIQHELRNGSASIVSGVSAGIERNAVSVLEKLDVTICALQALTDIRVTVQDIGTSVTENIGKLLQDSFAQEVGKLLGEQKVHLESIVAKLSEALDRSLDKTMTQLAETIATGFEGIRASQTNMASQDMSVLLGELQNIGGGQIRGEKEMLVSAMKSLSEVLPALEASIGGISERIRTDLESVGQKNAVMAQEYLSGMGSMIQRSQGAIDEQMSAMSLATGELQSGVSMMSSRFAEVQKQIETCLDSFATKQSEAVNASMISLRSQSETAIGRSMELLNQKVEDVLLKLGSPVDLAAGRIELVMGQLAGTADNVERIGKRIALSKDHFTEISETAAVTAKATIDTMSMFAQSASSLNALHAEIRSNLAKFSSITAQHLELQNKLTQSQSQANETLKTVPDISKRFANEASRIMEHVMKDARENAVNASKIVDASHGQFAEKVEALSDSIQDLRSAIEKIRNG